MMFKLLLFPIMLLWGANAAGGTPPGHPSTDEAARVLGLPAQATLPYQGRVLQALDSNSYTYIEVEGPQGQRLWLAAPRIPLSAKAGIRFGDGTLMNNFYSKKLERTFAQVLFVPAVEVIRP